MSATLAGTKASACVVHAVMEQPGDGGQMIEFARNQEALVRKPDRAFAKIIGDQDNFQLFYDGKNVTLFNPAKNVYATVDAPATIDQTMELLATKYGISAPLADLAGDDPYKVLTEHLISARYVGEGYVVDTLCHHLACTQDAADWQIWIDSGRLPLPRKICITYKKLPGQPRYTAYFVRWDLAPAAPDPNFVFMAPPTAKAVPLLDPAHPVTHADAGAPSK